MGGYFVIRFKCLITARVVLFCCYAYAVAFEGGVLRLNWFVILSSCIVLLLQLRFVSVIFWIEDIKLLGAEVFIVTF